MIELWKPIKWADGFFISNRGRIRKGDLLKISTARGYCFFGGKSVHRIVYESFKKKIKKGFQINHINRIKNDNRIENLEEVTPKENILHYHNHAKLNNPISKKCEFCKKPFTSYLKTKFYCSFNCRHKKNQISYWKRRVGKKITPKFTE